MKRFVLFACSLVVSISAHSDVAVIVAKSSTLSSVDVAELERMYSGKSKTLGGNEVEPLNQAEGNGVTDEFNRLVLNKSSSQVKAYWSKLVFTGKGQPPKELGSDAKMIEAVKSDTNVIGYVDAAAVSGDVKVLATLK